MSAGFNQTSDDPPEGPEGEDQTESAAPAPVKATGPKSAPRLPQNRGVGWQA